jgi:hypothetical protein
LITHSKNQIQESCLAFQDDNNEVTMRDYILQLDELVDPYRVTLFTDLEENSNFCVNEKTFVDVDIKELNDTLRTIRHTEIDEDGDSDEIYVEDCNEDDKDEIEEEENNFV